MLELVEFLKTLPPTLGPYLLVYLVGVIVADVERKNHRRPAALMLVSCGVLLLITAVNPFVYHYLGQQGWTIDVYRRWQSAVGIIRMMLHLAAFSLLLVAVFSDRSRPEMSTDAAENTLAMHSTDRAPRFRRATFILVIGFISSVVWAWLMNGSEFTRLGLLLSGPLGIVAWVMGSNDLAAMRTGRMDRSTESLTRAGQILGIIGTVLFALGIAVTVWATFVDAG